MRNNALGLAMLAVGLGWSLSGCKEPPSGSTQAPSAVSQETNGSETSHSRRRSSARHKRLKVAKRETEDATPKPGDETQEKDDSPKTNASDSESGKSETAQREDAGAVTAPALRTTDLPRHTRARRSKPEASPPIADAATEVGEGDDHASSLDDIQATHRTKSSSVDVPPSTETPAVKGDSGGDDSAPPKDGASGKTLKRQSSVDKPGSYKVASLTIPSFHQGRVRLKPGGSGRLAIIIDDVGMSTSQISPFLNLDADLTYSIIPDTRQARRCLSLIQSKGHVPMLHLPMESYGHRDLLPQGAIMTSLKDNAISSQVEKDLDELPGVQGVNNHMGSKATQDERVMQAVLGVVKQRGLFFIDSKTEQQTVVGDVADRLGVSHAARSGEFLDDGGRTDRAYSILLALGREALRDGSAIGIGHPHPGTARAIAQALPELAAMGVKIVPVSDLVH